jgi:hypothetical protein
MFLLEKAVQYFIRNSDFGKTARNIGANVYIRERTGINFQHSLDVKRIKELMLQS